MASRSVSRTLGSNAAAICREALSKRSKRRDSETLGDSSNFAVGFTLSDRGELGVLRAIGFGRAEPEARSEKSIGSFVDGRWFFLDNKSWKALAK
jgi:hypothetical protein